MNRDEAGRLLLGGDSRARLRAARWFSKHAQEADHKVLRQAIDIASDPWTREALTTALENLHRPTGDVATQPEDDGNEIEQGLIEEIYSEAVEETTAQLVHELEPVLGVLKVYARREIPDYEKSQTFTQILRLERLLGAIDSLRRAASPPSMVELDLSDTIRRVAAAIRESSPTASEIAFGGPRPFIVVGDQALIELALANGIKNALESSSLVEGTEKPSLVVTWGDSERESWVAVLDEGVGIPAGRTSSVFEIGVTSKRDHLGMGLALAKQAVTSLRGEISLEPRTPRGAVYRFSWPKPSTR